MSELDPKHIQTNNIQEILDRLKKNEYTDTVHGVDHLLHVHSFAMYLAGEYEGKVNTKVLEAAVLLHDADRRTSDSGGIDDRIRSAGIATEILIELDFTPAEIADVYIAILDHDQKEYTPSTMEGKILRDADILAGLGAHGILRVIMATTQRGEPIESVFERLDSKMDARIATLIFPESRELADKERLYVQDFLTKLSTVPSEIDDSLLGRMGRVVDYMLKKEFKIVAPIFATSLTAMVLTSRYEKQIVQVIDTLPEEFRGIAQWTAWLGLLGYSVSGILSSIYMLRTVENTQEIKDRLFHKQSKNKGGQLE